MNLKVLTARKERRLTQGQLASTTGINPADIVRIERRGWIPPAEVRQRLAEALGTAEEELFGTDVKSHGQAAN